jgi:hypothetical protein
VEANRALDMQILGWILGTLVAIIKRRGQIIICNSEFLLTHAQKFNLIKKLFLNKNYFKK